MNGYQLSPRVTLQPGDRFRASGGPYWRCGDERIPMAARGVFTLVEVLRRRSRVYLLAVGREGYCLLHVEGRRKNKSMPNLVCRPYRIRRAASQKNPRAQRKTA
jgi:hypothetical protein